MSMSSSTISSLLSRSARLKRLFSLFWIGAFIHNWIPEDLIVKILGTGNPFGVIIATIVGIPMYADIFGTIPIAEALLAKGANLGVVLAFMMGVTTLSIPSMIMLKRQSSRNCSVSLSASALPELLSLAISLMRFKA